MYFAPKGPQHTSPGQRPGTRYAETNSALKGRNNQTAGRDRSFVTPFQGYCGTVVLDSRGVAPGWYVAAPSGRKNRIGHATPNHRENGHLMPFSNISSRALRPTVFRHFPAISACRPSCQPTPHPDSAGGKRSGSSMYFAPKGPQHTSPGQRPGTRYAETNSALKGRNNQASGHERSFVTPFQGYCGTVVLDTRGVAPGWYVAAPSGRKNRIGHATPNHRENGHLMPFRIFPHALCGLPFSAISPRFGLPPVMPTHAPPRFRWRKEIGIKHVFRPEGAATYQPRATPWDPIRRDRFSPKRAKQRNGGARAFICDALSGLLRYGGSRYPGRCPGLVCCGPFGAKKPNRSRHTGSP